MNSCIAHTRLSLRVFPVAIAILLLAACTGQDPAQFIKTGQAHFDKKEYRAAAIEFKNALQKDASLNDARYLLGLTLLESGDSAGALVEFKKLWAVNYQPEQVGPLLARSQLAQGEIDKLIADWSEKSLETSKSRAQISASLASAYGIRGKLDEARLRAEASLKDDPDGLEGRLVMAQLKVVREDVQGAMDDVAAAESRHPNSVRPKIFKAELMSSSRGRYEAAAIETVYRDVLKLEPQNVQAHAGLIELAMKRNDRAGAAAQFELLRKAQPNGVLTHYFEALLALDRRDLRAALQASQQALKAAPQNPGVLQLAGRIAFEAGNYAQAVAHLSKALPISTQAVPVRLLLTRALLRMGDNKKAFATVQPLLSDRTGIPAEAFTLAADAQVRLGNSDKAKQLYQRALSTDSRDARARSALAVFDISEGRFDQGVTALRDVASLSKGLEADALVVTTYLRSRRLEQARAAIDVIDQKQPDSSIASYLRGELALAKGDAAEAIKQFELSAQRDTKDFSPVSALAALEIRAGKPEAALARYRAFLEKTPQSINADLAIIELGKERGAAPAKTAADLDLIVKKYPDSELPRNALVRALLEAGDVKRAQAVATEAAAAFPLSPAAVESVGVAELSAGNISLALQAFSQLATLKPNEAAPLIRLSQAHMANKDTPAALAQLVKAVSTEPASTDAHFQLVALLARLGKHEQALTQARAAQTAVPADPLGWMLEGDLRAGKADRAAAVAAYRTGLAKARIGASAVKLHRAFEDAGQLKEAQKLEAEWRTERPTDPVFNYYLGDRYLALGELDKASALYRNVLDVVPNDPASLNNLAWILAQQGKPGALEMSERAVALAPKSGAFLDTLAEIHARAGRIDRALIFQRQALETSSSSPLYRLHLAKYLIQDKQMPAARKELEALAAMGTKFSGQDEVKRLMRLL